MENPKGRITSEMYKGNNDIEKIVIPEGITIIENDAFLGCHNLKKVTLPSTLKYLGTCAFEDCYSLEEITIPESLQYIPESAFKNCHNLKRVNIHDHIIYIDDDAFLNCYNLEAFQLPSEIETIGIRAFSHCDKIKHIDIPEKLNDIGMAAFAEMNSLEKITVHPHNHTYTSDEDVALIDSENGNILQYAIANKKEEYIVGYYEKDEMTCLIYNILNFAFTGAKYLKTIYIPSELESIGPDTFKDCPNLKTLKIFFTPYGKVLLIRDNAVWKRDAHIPFEDITIEDGVTSLADNLSFIFKNTKKVSLPNTLEEIGSNVFTEGCLQSLNIPSSVISINPNAFADDMEINMFGFKTFKAKDIALLTTQRDKDYRRKEINKNDSKVLAMKDGTYYVFLNDYAPIKVSKDEIDSLSKSSCILHDEPDVFLDYLIDLLSLNANYHEQFINIISNENLKKLFEQIFQDMEYVRLIAQNKHENYIREILANSNNNDELLFNGIIMRNLSKRDLILMINNMTPSLRRFIMMSKIFNNEGDTYENRLLFDNMEKLINYTNLLETYQRYDRFLYQPCFALYLPTKYLELLVSHYNANIKRMLIASKIFDGNDNEGHNLNDLLKLATILGVFSDDEKISQRALTFITEKMLMESDNGKINNYKINGDDIHRVCAELNPRDELDYEFIRFFMNNYQELIDIEKTTSGFIARVYNSFKDISKGSSANTGEQRHLLVTINRCKNYFLMKTYPNATEDNLELARALARFFDNEKLLDVAISILDEAHKAPRNIFGKYTLKDDKRIFINDEDEDLKEEGFTYNYEWLPKQDVENLFLGKYCNCCAHIEGAGAGIMRASMILDNVQNLVIRDEEGTIIAKMTLWVDRDKGYGVFNTAEVNLNHRETSQLESIYEAFLRGLKAFLNRYNENNPHEPITILSIGDYRNALKEMIKRDNSEETSLPTIDYSTQGYYVGSTFVGAHRGDDFKQLLLYRKEGL